jgi:Zn-dependent protease/CBS domain-containing protein
VPIFITPSWLLVSAFITITYADLLHRQIFDVSMGLAYVLAFVYAIALAVSVILHEIGHTLVSHALGLPVRRIVVFLLGGVSEIEGEPRRPRDEFSIAAAGPAVSFALAGFCWALSALFTDGSAAETVLSLLAWTNLVLAVFNILPGLPLDGGRLVQALVWTLSASRLRGIRVAAWAGRGLSILLAVGVLVGTSEASHDSNSSLAPIVATGAGFAIAAFMWFGAAQTLRQAEILDQARTLNLQALIRRAVYVPATTPVSEAVRQVHESGASAIVVVDSQRRSRAIVPEAAVTDLDVQRRPWVTVAELAHDLGEHSILPDNLTGEALLEIVSAHPSAAYLVIGTDGVSRGILVTADLARVLATGTGTR